MPLTMYSLTQPIFEDWSQDACPAVLRSWNCGLLELPALGTHFGFVYEGHPTLYRNPGEAYILHPGMYFSLPAKGYIDGKASSGIVISRLEFQGMFSIGGAIESTGRFAYIDGGTNSLLIPPIYQGDPCLNALYFPSGVEQTLHTHPSYRIGIVVKGSGKCETPNGSIDMKPGVVFLIPADSLHKFRTTEEGLILVVFHPDSDIGFYHHNNPMIRRTIVEGVSAAELPQIQTKVFKTI